MRTRTQLEYRYKLSKLGKCLHYLKIIVGYYDVTKSEYNIHLNPWNPLSYIFSIIVIFFAAVDIIISPLDKRDVIMGFVSLWTKGNLIITYKDLDPA